MVIALFSQVNKKRWGRRHATPTLESLVVKTSGALATFQTCKTKQPSTE